MNWRFLISRPKFGALGQGALGCQRTRRRNCLLMNVNADNRTTGGRGDAQRRFPGEEIAGNLAVKAGQITRLDTLGQVAAIVVHAPNVKGLDMKAVYALKAAVVRRSWCRSHRRCLEQFGSVTPSLSVCWASSR